MGKRESVIVSCCIGVIVPVSSFFAAWWGSVPLVPEKIVPVCATAGLGIGIILDALLLKRWTARVYSAPLVPLALLHLWLSIIVYGVTMGVAAFLLVPGTAAGVYMGRRLRAAGTEGVERARSIRRAGAFTALVIGVACAASGFLAIVQPGMGEDLRSMLHLSFDVTKPMIVGTVVLGAALLVVAQYFLTAKAALVASGEHHHGD